MHLLSFELVELDDFKDERFIKFVDHQIHVEQ